MNLSDQELKELRPMIASWISDDLIRNLFSMMSEKMEPELAGSVLVSTLKQFPEGSDEEMILAVARKHLNREEGENVIKAGDAKKITRDYLDSLLLEMRLMGSTLPNTEIDLFGKVFSSPIMTAALSHLGRFEKGKETMMDVYAKAAKQTNILHWIGMCDNDWFEQIADLGAETVRIVKPYADEEKLIDQLIFAKEHKAIAVGIDIDHTFTTSGTIDVILGEKMEAKSLEQMKKYKDTTDLPFIVKGVLSVRDALLCKEIGADAIVVSHHGGRLPYAVAPVSILPDIKKAVKDELKIFVDCGITSGMDAYKALALGADAVSVGTHLIPYLRKGEDAAIERIEAMKRELSGAMAYTGVRDCHSFDASVIHRR